MKKLEVVEWQKTVGCLLELPANPNTNLSNVALGYFGAFTIRTGAIIIR